jgi:xylulokinase
MRILGLDIGTSGCKALVFDDTRNVVHHAYREYDLIDAGEDRLELDAETVWEKTRETIEEARGRGAGALDGVAVSALGDVVIPLDERGRAVRPSIIDFDPRGEEEIGEFIEGIGTEKFFEITGMPPIHINSLAKILWIKKHEPRIYGSVRRWATFEDYVLYRLGARPRVSYSMAARTMLFDVQRKCWAREIVDAAGLDEAALPEAVPSGIVVDRLRGEAAADLGFSANAAVCSGGHDMVCAAIGAGLDSDGPRTALNIVGTMEAVIVLLKKPELTREMLKRRYPCYPGFKEYLSLSLNLTSGSIVKWYRDLVTSHSGNNGDGSDYGSLLQEIDDSSPGDLFLIPHFSGSCNPTFNPDARGLLYGLSLTTTKRDLTQSIIEGLCYELKAHVLGFEEAGISIDRLKTVGGGSQSKKWLQLKSNITGLEIIGSDIPEASALGAAALCATALGVIENPYRISASVGAGETRYTPSPQAAGRFEEKFSRYLALKKGIDEFEIR